MIFIKFDGGLFMRKARVLVLMLAVLAAVASMMLVRNAGSRNAAISRPIETIDVLIAARSFTSAETITTKDVKWQPWPKNAVPKGGILRSGNEENTLLPAPARFPIQQGEPLVKAKLVHPGSGSAMASLLAAGMRAVPVQLRQETNPGNAIKANDRVDVLLARKSREIRSGKTNTKGVILLRSVRVLAIGKDEKNKSRSSAHHLTATLELSPKQTRRLIGAQGSGEITLALVSAADKHVPDEEGDFEEDEPAPVKMLKFGRRQ
jgi:pilus assembly protein CpaB